MSGSVNANHLRQLLVVAKMLRQLDQDEPLFETAATALEDRARRIAWGHSDRLQQVSQKYPLNIVC